MNAATSSIEKPVVLMVDDDPGFLEMYQLLLKEDFDVRMATCVQEGLRSITGQPPDVVLLDMVLPNETEGLDAIPLIRKTIPGSALVVVTNKDSHTLALEALRRGADDYFVKSGDIQELKAKIQLLLETKQLAPEEQSVLDSLPDLVIKSPAMKQLYLYLLRLARTSFSLLIRGEMGVGKEMAARFLHSQSPRRTEPFVAVNCASIPESLFENEMFGHESGAYTHAQRRYIGKLEQANGGTLFLDEIGKLSLRGQAALLRVLEERRFQRLGGREFHALDIRLVAATNDPLEAMMQEGKFLPELYHRIVDEEVTIPPLRERQEDIVPLSLHFLEQVVKEEHFGKKKFTDQALLALKSHHWPGNVRELQKTVRRAALRSYGRQEIRPVDLGLPSRDEPEAVMPYEPAREQALRDFQRRYFKPLLARYGGNLTLVARAAGISRQGLQKILKALGLGLKDE